MCESNIIDNEQIKHSRSSNTNPNSIFLRVTWVVRDFGVKMTKRAVTGHENGSAQVAHFSAFEISIRI